MNTALFVDETTGIPIFYEHFIGSIPDKTESPITIEKAETLGYDKLFLVMDTGYFSTEVASVLKNKFKFSITAPESANISKDMISSYGKQIALNQQFYLPGEHAYGIRASNKNVLGGRYNACLFYDDKRASEERQQIQNKVATMKCEALKKKRYTNNLAKKYAPWLRIEKLDGKDDSGRSFAVKENADRVQQEIDNAGFFVVVSNAELDPTSMLRVVRHRDQGEKPFQRFKSHLGLTSPYVHGEATYEGKMFVAFIALIIVQSYRWFIRSLLAASSSTTIYTTLRECEKCQIMRKPDGSWMPRYALTRKEKDIFECLQLTPDEVLKGILALHA